MASSTLIVDYLGFGTHAARPASPSLPTGGIGIYLESDTGNLCVWNGSAWVIPNSSLVASVALTAQNASIGVTTLLAAPTAGLYRASGAIQLTTAGTSGTVSSAITYKDINGNSETDELVSAVTFGTLNNHGGGSIVFWANSGTAIQYSTTVTSAVGSPVYAVQFTLERI
jgi:hypothetical protein